MKVGDKVYCTCTRYDLDSKDHTNDKILTEGKYYTISEIEDNFIRITSDLDYVFNYRKLHSDLFYSFDDFFMTEKEHRKVKLKKIYESWR